MNAQQFHASLKGPCAIVELTLAAKLAFLYIYQYNIKFKRLRDKLNFVKKIFRQYFYNILYQQRNNLLVKKNISKK
jgi:hypothetical protein